MVIAGFDGMEGFVLGYCGWCGQVGGKAAGGSVAVCWGAFARFGGGCGDLDLLILLLFLLFCYGFAHEYLAEGEDARCVLGVSGLRLGGLWARVCARGEG